MCHDVTLSCPYFPISEVYAVLDVALFGLFLCTFLVHSAKTCLLFRVGGEVCVVCPIWLHVFSFFSNTILNEPGLGTLIDLTWL